jgi:hypothetical protein
VSLPYRLDFPVGGQRHTGCVIRLSHGVSGDFSGYSGFVAIGVNQIAILPVGDGSFLSPGRPRREGLVTGATEQPPKRVP